MADVQVSEKNGIALHWMLLIPVVGTAKEIIMVKTRKRYVSSITDRCMIKKLEPFLL